MIKLPLKKAALCLTTFLCIATASVSAAPNESSINWEDGDNSYITAVGISRPDSRGLALAREAAIVLAQRNLLSVMNGVQINSETIIRDLMTESDVVKRNISGLLVGAKIYEEKALQDGSYIVKMRIPLYGKTGSVASAVLPTVMPQETEPIPQPVQENIPQPEAEKIQSENYTGVIIDAQGMNLSPTFSPVIYDENGRDIYGAKNINPDFAVSQGMVSYAKDINDEAAKKRAGNNPLIIKAASVKGGASPQSMVNVVVTVADADKILLANETGKFLVDCKVVFVR
ncbi:MAG: hypothetical protein J6O04_02065 [Selenomonadaceae bacterium]|nr:hypothetical protein [Selenomonadaceae bacterium]